MALVFSFFQDDAILEGGAHVYVGEVKKQDEAPLAYRIKWKGGQCWLFDGRPKEYGRRELLHAKFDGFAGFYSGTGEIRGYNSIYEMGVGGFFSKSFKFTDSHTNRKYKWKLKWPATSWELRDPEKKTVASFERHIFKISRQGRLTIYQQHIPEHLLALILLTSKLMHNFVKAAERRNAKANN